MIFDQEGIEATPQIYLDAMYCFSKKHRDKEALALYDELKRHHVRMNVTKNFDIRS